MKSYSSLRNDDIDGTKPKKLYCKTERKSLSLFTTDILGAKSSVIIEKLKRNTPRNPLEGFKEQSPLGSEGCLKYFGPKLPNRFIRDAIKVTDIEGAKVGNKF
jgi:hypothetical protein